MPESGFEYLRELLQPNETKIVLMVIDGLGGMPLQPGGATELESARTPNLDKLACEGICGLHDPVATGITPGSGPGHLGVFGYDPLLFTTGRGVLAAAGIDFDLQPGDVAARGNFCTVDKEDRITDRRAGRIDSTENKRLCNRLRDIKPADGVEMFIETIKEHRFLMVLRGKGLCGAVHDTDPQKTGVPALAAQARHPDADPTASLVQQITKQARERLREETHGNMILLRGFAEKPDWPQFADVFGLRAAAAAGYPMYRGLARLLGMHPLSPCDTLDDRLATVRKRFSDFDFFFLHIKESDSSGEDGDFAAKVQAIEMADQIVPTLRALEPDVLIVTGDHSTPAVLGTHSWHPVPALLWSETCRPDGVARFAERDCLAGAMGPRFPARELLPLALAHAGRLQKYGA